MHDPAERGWRHLGSLLLLLIAAHLVSCASAPPHRPPAVAPPPTASTTPGSAGASEPGAFRWTSSAVPAIRVTPLDNRGEPTPCVTDETRRPCDLEVTAAGQVFERSRSPAPAGVIGPGLRVRRRAGEDRPVFTLEPTGALAGVGIFHRPDAVQLLFCHLTDEPVLQCRHELRDSVRGRVRNEENCTGTLVARAEGAAIRATSPEDPSATVMLVARIDPPPADAAAKALALFLYAMDLVYRDTTHHTPYVDDMQAP